MARSTVKKNKITKDGWEIISSDLVEYFELIKEEKAIELEEIHRLFSEALARGLVKHLDGGNGPEPEIEVQFNPQNNGVKMVQLKDVVEEVEDDFLQVQLDEIGEDFPEAKLGDKVRISFVLSDFDYPTVQALMQSFNQKIIEAEKRILFEVYKDKVDTIINGRVDRVEGNNIFVNIGKTIVRLTRKDLIGSETFEAKEEIKVYVDKVSATTKGAQIEVSRSHTGFLRKIFQEEIPEVYEKVVLIKSDEPANGFYGIVREPGYRAKVAVYTNVPNLDPVATCIGPNGSRIQKIVAYLGKGKYRENVDVVLFSRNMSLFIAEALKPANISGIVLNEEQKSAIVVVPNDNVSVAIGVRGSNIRLAQQMTGIQLKILTETEAIDQQVSFIPLTEVVVDDRRRVELTRQNEIQQRRQQQIEAMQNLKSESEVEIDDKYVDENEEESVQIPTSPVVTTVIEDIIATPSEYSPEVIVLEEVTAANKPVVEDRPKEKAIITVTTTTLDELEKQLELEKQAKTTIVKKKFRKDKKTDDKNKDDADSGKTYQKLDIVYTEEELEEADQELVDNFEDEIDLEDFEDYYDEE